MRRIVRRIDLDALMMVLLRRSLRRGFLPIEGADIV